MFRFGREYFHETQLYYNNYCNLVKVRINPHISVQNDTTISFLKPFLNEQICSKTEKSYLGAVHANQYLETFFVYVIVRLEKVH